MRLSSVLVLATVAALGWAIASGGCATAPGVVDGNLEVCPVHGERLLNEKREINYGLYRFPEGWFEARDQLFPHANTHNGGGCVVGPEKWTNVKYCEACRKAERDWHDSRPDGWK